MRARTDARAATAATLAAALIIGQQIAAKATRDALFLSSLGAQHLPKAMIASGVLSIAAALFATRLLARFGPARIVPVAFAASASLFASEWALFERAPGAIAVALYLHLAAFSALAISAFWSLASERFDPHTAKAVFGKINAGAALGGVLGGLTAERLAGWLGPSSMLLVLVFINAACALSVSMVGTPERSGAKVEQVSRSSVWAAFRETAYLRRLGALIGLTAVGSALVDFGLRASASSSMPNGPELLSFFAVLYTATGACTFVFQLTLVKRALARFGLGITAGLLPLVLLVLGIVAVVSTNLWTLLALAAAEDVLSNSMFRSAYELLYTPVAPSKKRAAKTLIDVGFKRVGDIAGGGLVMALVAVAPQSLELMPAAVAVVGAIAFLVTYRLQRGYFDTVVESLKSGAITLAEEQVVDRTTKRALLSTMAFDRRQLLHQIEELRRNEGARGGLPDDELERLRAGASALLSGDPVAARAVLAGDVDRRLLALVIPWLARPETAAEAESALVRAAPRATGQLLDALFDEALPLVIRMKLPDIMARAGGRRSAEALLEALGSNALDVAASSARALGDLRDRDPALAPSKERVFVLTERALERMRGGALGRRMLEHVFDLLGLVLERPVLDLVRRALATEDRRLRGTALEYLDNVLPPHLRDALSPHLGAAPSPRPRSAQEVVEELMRSKAEIDLAGGLERER
jgi:ATP:ADP antiporter, AAA family